MLHLKGSFRPSTEHSHLSNEEPPHVALTQDHPARHRRSRSPRARCSIYACAPTSSNAGIGAAADAPSRVYVAPGSYDDYYAFMSGGFSGQLAVYGLPSGRLLKVIPVFSQNPENGYGYNAETKGDAEHDVWLRPMG